MLTFSRLGCTVQDGVARVQLDHAPLNILDTKMLKELQLALEGLHDRKLKALLLETPHRAFSAGADVGEHLPEQAAEMLAAFHGAVRAVLDFPYPTVAAVHGAAMGGGFELMLACDLVVASEQARFAVPEIRLGVFPPLAAVLLPRLLPPRLAWEMVFTGRSLSVARAEELGLVNRVVPPEQLAQAVEELLTELRGLSGPALRLCKKALRLRESELAQALAEAESIYLGELMLEPDALEGLTAFLQKRPPIWSY